jgi:isoleucyl-tRNA synthetase
VRLPLAGLIIAAEDAAVLEPFAEVLRDEVNVKSVSLTTDVDAHGHFQLAVNARAAGPRLGPDVQKVIKAVKAGDWSEVDGRVVAAGVELLPEEYEQRLVARDAGATAALPGNSGLVVLDTAVTEELAAEGVARDLVRVVQQARKDAGLEVSDRIALVLRLPEAVEAAVRAFEAFVKEETLTESVSYGEVPEGGVGVADGVVGDGRKVRVAVSRV